MTRIVRGLAALSVLSLAGCGGDGTSMNMAASYPGTASANCQMGMSGCSNSSATQQMNSAPRPSEPFSMPSTTLTASAHGNTYSLTYSVTTNSNSVSFDGQMAQSSAIVATVAENGTTIGTQTTTAYYLTSPYVPLGFGGKTVNGTAFEVIFNSINPYPSTLTVGESGTLASGNFYTPGSNTAIGSLTVTYAVEANNSSSLLLKVSSSATVATNPLPEVIAYAVDASGHLSLSSIQITLNGVTLTFM
jgi:hypothetical protein